ncbi:MAG: DUF4430 domain-containing protein [Peptococcaceae bacterium]|jgi:hypothetical protein|nr:DUF4430 domain-containing protein [Peptococcaceae bacterium]
MKKKRKLLSILLILAMCLQLLPTTALAVDETAKTSHNYLDSFDITYPDNTPVSMLDENKKIVPFEFKPDKLTYDIVLPDATMPLFPTLAQTQFKASLSENFAGTAKLSSMWSKTGTDFANGSSHIFADNGLQHSINYATLQLMPIMADASKAVQSRYYIIGLSDSPVGDVSKFSKQDVYTFKFYFQPRLQSLTAISGENTYSASAFNPYDADIIMKDIKPDTQALNITTKVATQTTSTTLKFDNGTGTYDVYKIDDDVQADKAYIDLSKYDKAPYKKAEGYYVIPFMLDYAGNDNNKNVAGVDGYYTLTILFEGVSVDYTPEFSKEAKNVNVKVGAAVDPLTFEVKKLNVDTANSLTYKWYSATKADGSDKTPIADATGASYTPPATTVGTTYYFCEATRTVDGTPYTTLSKAVKVTVTADGQAGGNIIKNVTIQNNNRYNDYNEDYIIFGDFTPETHIYNDIKLPYGLTTYKMLVEPTEEAYAKNKTGVRYDLSLTNESGEVIYSSDKKWFNVIQGSKGITDLLNYDQLANKKPGNYIYTIKAYEIDEDAFNADKSVNEIAGTAEEYTFNIKIFPAIAEFKALADGRELTLQPAINQKDYSSRYVWEYNTNVPTGTEKIVLTALGTTNKYQAIGQNLKIIYKGNDVTADFKNTETGGGVEIDLTQCLKDENGKIIVPFTIAHVDDSTGTDYKLLITEVAGGNWQITKQPVGGTFNKGDKVVLTVETNAGADEVTYQWQDASGKAIGGATSASYIAPTNYGGSQATKSYRCAITDKATGTVAYSDFAKVEVNLGQVSAPEITYQPGKYTFSSVNEPNGEFKTTYQVGEKPEDAIQACVNAPEGDAYLSKYAPVKIEMQWYYNTKESTEGAKPVEGSSNSHNGRARLWNCAIPNNLTVGEHYYFFVATAVSVEDETNRASVTSDFVKITITGRSGLDGFEGKGTSEDPYIIKTVDDFKKIDEYVLSGDFLGGAVFRMANDIELPLDWEPIGEDKGGHGKNLLPFSGTIDGAGHKLTVAEGGRPLLEYARDAKVLNLDIYGKKINGAGLLEKGTIDYGPDGIYQELTDPDVITLENVKLLSGSQTKDSGLVFGGETSGINDVIIKNCVIQPGVIVGYDKQQSAIGSFVGKLNGRIENSVSYAEVYGINNVGGLAAYKGQSMGACEVVNSAFLGKIVATGSRAGGILAAGYISGSAPSTPPVTIRNCYVAANITANGGAIGGILGSEEGAIGLVNRGAIRDNHFYGTITDTNPDAAARYKDVGGILGKSGSYNADLLTYQNNYYLTNANYTGLGSQAKVNATWQPNEESFIAKTAEEFAGGDVLKLLNEGDFKNWQQGDKYPTVDLSKVVPVALTISGEYKREYYIGDELDLSGAVFTLNMSDGSKQTLALSDIAISGYDKNTRAVQTLTASYGAVNVNFEVTVLKKPEQSTPGTNPNIIKVYFTLMGDSVHGAPASDKDTHTYKSRNLQTWIAKKAYEVDLNATVLDVFEKALTEAGMTWKNSDGNYIEAITNNGQTLAEFSNGNLSGWMYLLNGERSLLGVSEQFLENGDNIIFHYTDDWTVEKGSDNLSGSGGGNKGNAAGGAAGGVSGVVLNPGTVEGADGKNLATMTVKEITKAIENAKNDSVKNIIIEPNIKGSASNVSLSLPIDSLNDMAKEQMNLYMNSRQGSLNLSAAVLQSIAKQAGGIDIRLNVENKELKQDDVKASAANALAQAAANLRGAAESLLANASVTEVTVTSNGKAITSFDGHDLTVYLPVSNRDLFTEGQNYKVVVISSDGTVETIIGKCVKYNAQIMVQVKVNHLSTFIVTNETEKEVVAQPQNGAMNFSDVKENQWFYEAVKFVYEAGLMNGEGENSFNPNGNLNRAMLVTILYRLEQSPEVTTASKFTDVKAGQWYSEAVIWASENGIVNGYEDNTFKPMNNVSREEMAAMLMRYAKFKQIDVSATKDISGYQDAAQVAEWAKQNMAWSNSAGLIQGDEHNNLNPQGKATRAEAAMILMRLVKNVL